MDYIIFALVYLAIGLLLSRFICVKTVVDWDKESFGDKALILGTIFVWPIAFCFVVSVWIKSRQ